MVLLTRQQVSSLTSFSFLCLYHGDLGAGEEADSCSDPSVSLKGGHCSVCVCAYFCI